MGDFFYGLTRAIWALFITLIFGDDATGTVGVLGNGMKTWIGEEAAAGVEYLNGLFMIVASSLVTVFWMYGLVKRISDLRELKRPETLFSAFLQLGICQCLIVSNKFILNLIFDFCLDIFDILNKHGGNILGSDTNTLINIIPEMDPVDTTLGSFTLFGDMLPSLLIQFINFFVYGGFFLIVTVMGIVIIITLFTRHLRVILHFIVAPLPLSGFAGTRETQHSGVSFIRSFISVCLQDIIVILVFLTASLLSVNLFNTSGMDISEIIYTHVPMLLVESLKLMFGDNIITIMVQMIETIVTGLKVALIAMAVKGVDSYTQKILGL